MHVSVDVVKHSSYQDHPELITLAVTYPRFIHAEVMTHRVFSRNASSSRAIPVNRMLDIISRKPAKPLYWGSNKPGMQAADELTGWRYHAANLLWSAAARTACTLSRLMGFVGLHKQHTNRITEPFQYITTLITATEWDNFFELRNHPDAQPEIQLLAMEMKRAIDESEPVELNQGEWHLPYIRYDEFGTVPFRMIQEASAARCARVSYLNHDGSQPNLQKDILLFKRLAGSKPLHASPLEHVAVPSWKDNANFVGWKQFRKTVEYELL